MKSAKLIYNPFSGDKSFPLKLDMVLEKLQSSGYEVTPYRTSSIDDIYKGIENSKDKDIVIASGGDGTINHVINAMKKFDIDLPLGIIPSGTANDFASHINISKNVSEACDIISNANLTKFDTGMVNNRYFINVASAGLLTDVSQKIDINLKNTLGKMAYYIKGIGQLPNFKPIKVRISSKDNVIEEMLYLFLILNGSSAGGFKLASEASANDGKLDLIAIKSCRIKELVNLFFKMLQGEHLENSNVIYLQGEEFFIECEDNIETDIDGENGPNFPLNISVSNKKINIFTP